MTDRPDSPGVRLPPPALYAVAPLAGYLLHRGWPLPVGNSVVVQTLAWLLMGVWLALTISSIGNSDDRTPRSFRFAQPPRS